MGETPAASPSNSGVVCKVQGESMNFYYPILSVAVFTWCDGAQQSQMFLLPSVIPQIEDSCVILVTLSLRRQPDRVAV